MTRRNFKTFASVLFLML